MHERKVENWMVGAVGHVIALLTRGASVIMIDILGYECTAEAAFVLQVWSSHLTFTIRRVG